MLIRSTFLQLASSFPNYDDKRNTTRSVLWIDSLTSEEYWRNERWLLTDSVNYVKRIVKSISSTSLTSKLNDVNSVVLGSYSGTVTSRDVADNDIPAEYGDLDDSE